MQVSSSLRAWRIYNVLGRCNSDASPVPLALKPLQPGLLRAADALTNIDGRVRYPRNSAKKGFPFYNDTTTAVYHIVHTAVASRSRTDTECVLMDVVG